MNERYSMDKIMSSNRAFIHHPYCTYAVDVTFQRSNQLSKNIEKGKLYFSGKHKLYGFEVEVQIYVMVVLFEFQHTLLEMLLILNFLQRY